MGSGYFGEPNLGNERPSLRKSKKSNSDKPKQPQRGLGVAQLEKIRLHTQMGYNPYATNLNQERLQTPYSSTSSYAFPPQQAIMDIGVKMKSYVGRWRGCAESQCIWHPGRVYEPQQFAQTNMNRYLIDLQIEDPMEKRTRNNSIGSHTSYISESNNDRELDLELRLSL